MGQQTHWMLTIRDESKPSFTVMLTSGEKVVIGRSRTCQVILADPAVSRKHCFFGVGDDGVLKLVDLGAQHPTSLNGVAIKAGCAFPVQDGFEVHLGRGSVIKVECLSGNLSAKAGHVDLVDDDDLETHTAVLEQPVSGEVKPHPEAGTPAADEATRLNKIDASKRSDFKKVNTSTPAAEVHQNHTQVLGQTLQGKLTQLKESKPVPVSNSPGPAGSDNGVLKDDADVITRPSGSDAQDETNCVDPAQLQKSMSGKARPIGKKSGNSGAASRQSSRTVDEAEKTALSDGDPQDETNYVDPAELQKLMKGKAGSVDKKKGGIGVPSSDDSQDETGYIDPAELQRLMKGKAGLFGKKGGKKRTAKGTSRKGEDAGSTAPAAGDSGDETGYVDPAELQKLMKGKAGLFGKKGGKKRTAPKGTARKGEDAGNTAPPDDDSQDETNFIDPAELQKIMKSKAKSPRSNKGRSR